MGTKYYSFLSAFIGSQTSELALHQGRRIVLVFQSWLFQVQDLFCHSNGAARLCHREEDQQTSLRNSRRCIQMRCDWDQVWPEKMEIWTITNSTKFSWNNLCVRGSSKILPRWNKFSRVKIILTPFYFQNPPSACVFVFCYSSKCISLLKLFFFMYLNEPICSYQTLISFPHIRSWPFHSPSSSPIGGSVFKSKV